MVSEFSARSLQKLCEIHLACFCLIGDSIILREHVLNYGWSRSSNINQCGVFAAC